MARCTICRDAIAQTGRPVCYVCYRKYYDSYDTDSIYTTEEVSNGSNEPLSIGRDR